MDIVHICLKIGVVFFVVECFEYVWKIKQLHNYVYG